MNKFFVFFALPAGVLMIFSAMALNIIFDKLNTVAVSAVAMCGLVTLWSSFIGNRTAGVTWTEMLVADTRRFLWFHVVAGCLLVLAGLQLANFEGWFYYFFIVVYVLTVAAYVAASHSILGVWIKQAPYRNPKVPD